MKRIKKRIQHPLKEKIVKIPVEIVKLEDNSYHLLVSVEIDSIKGDMIIDTGASVTVVDDTLFHDKTIKKAIPEIQSGGITGQISNVKIVSADLFRIGSYKMKNIRLAAIDLNYVNQMYEAHLSRKIIGLLGCDFCIKHRTVIDYNNKILSVRT